MSITNINAGQAVVQIIGNDSKLKKVLNDAGAGIQGFAQKWTAIGARLQAAGQMMFAPFQEAIRVFADFDDQMRRVAAVSGASGKAFADLTAQAKALGASTAFTASQVAAGMSSLGMMGFSPKEISGAMESVMNLSRATSTELAEAASIAANQLRQSENNSRYCLGEINLSK
ncbi:MAG: phage tail tape measure protein [Victivallales bacterium]|nr:phage tail tape measure protein [Victivallales bacterium]